MKTILWAIDPNQATPSAIDRETSTITQLFFQSELVSTEPVYVITPGILPPDVFSERLPSLKKDAMRKFSKLLISKSWPSLRLPVVLEEPTNHVENMVQTFMNYARSVRADLVVLGTHNRTTVSRFFLGSFAETLLLNSSIPLLLVHPSYSSAWPAQNPRKILFPTDFEKNSQLYFNKLVRVAKENHSQIEILHIISKRGKKYQSSLIEQMKQAAEALQEAAVRHQVVANFHLLTSDATVADVILDRAKKIRPLMIAMSAKSGEIRRLFAGSMTRQVVRGSTSPVWVMQRAPHR